MTRAEKIEKYILWLSFGCGLIFVIVELAMAVYSHSQSVGYGFAS